MIHPIPNYRFVATQGILLYREAMPAPAATGGQSAKRLSSPSSVTAISTQLGLALATDGHRTISATKLNLSNVYIMQTLTDGIPSLSL